MTCAECQELLLDLVYGELDAARAAQVEAHARSCPGCAQSMAELARTRTLVAPLAEAEEPPASLDAKILEAARTEAVLLGDGTQGPVISADVRVQPLAVEAAQIDARARVKVPARRDRRRWAVRAALAGSAATAAALAVVFSGGNRRVAPSVDESAYRIQVRTADEARRAAAAAAPKAQPQVAVAPARSVPSSDLPRAAAPAARPQDSAPAAAGDALSAPASAGGAPATAAAPGGAPAAPPAPAVAPSAAAPAAIADSTEAREDNAPAAKAPAAEAARQAAARPEAPAAGPPPRPAERKPAILKKQLAQVDAMSRRMGQAPAGPGDAPSRARQSAGAAAALNEASTAQSAPPPDPAGLERRAEADRRQGAFASAAALYREAFRARAAAGDAATASWDLAHAVECLAAAGRFAEARASRSELRTLYPDAQGPQAATDRALRTAPADDAPAPDRRSPR